jgi:hypothetical protein
MDLRARAGFGECEQCAFQQKRARVVGLIGQQSFRRRFAVAQNADLAVRHLPDGTEREV